MKPCSILCLLFWPIYSQRENERTTQLKHWSSHKNAAPADQHQRDSQFPIPKSKIKTQLQTPAPRNASGRWSQRDKRLRGFGARCQHCSRQWGKKGRRSSFPWSITAGHREYKGGWLCVGWETRPLAHGHYYQAAFCAVWGWGGLKTIFRANHTRDHARAFNAVCTLFYCEQKIYALHQNLLRRWLCKITYSVILWFRTNVTYWATNHLTISIIRLLLMRIY